MHDRVRAMVREAAAGLAPWQPIAVDRLAALGRRCGREAIAAVVAVLDQRSADRPALPGSDGDSYDEAGKAQAMHMRILGNVDRSHLAAVAEGLRRESPDTRGWVALALEMHGPAALPFLRAGRDAETVAHTRQFITEAIGRLETAGAST